MADINEIKKEVYSNYMQAAYTIMSSDEYKKYRKKHIWIFISIFLIMIAVCFLLIKFCSISDTFKTFCFALLYFVFIHNSYYSDGIKKRCMKIIMPDLLNVRFYKEEPKGESCVLHESEIWNLNLIKGFGYKKTDDIFFGNYNGIKYNVQEIELKTNEGKDIIEDIILSYYVNKKFDGMVLKADVNTKINGWIEFSTNEMEKSLNWNFAYYFTMYFLIIFIILALFLLLLFADVYLSQIFDSFTFAAVLVLAIFDSIITAAILAYGITKIVRTIESKKTNYKIKQRRSSSIININEQFNIKASNNIEIVDETVTQELKEVIDELKILFKTKMIKCKFCNDKIILVIKSKKNFFEIGNFYIPPTNKIVAERFVSQISGIILFLDYISGKKSRDDYLDLF